MSEEEVVCISVASSPLMDRLGSAWVNVRWMYCRWETGLVLVRVWVESRESTAWMRVSAFSRAEEVVVVVVLVEGECSASGGKCVSSLAWAARVTLMIR